MGWGHMTTNTPTPAQLANSPFSQSSMSIGQLAGYAAQQFNGAYNAYAQQSMGQQAAAAQQYAMAQQRAFNQVWTERRWQIDGRYMTLTDFVDYIWPEDCAEKTFFLLRHAGDPKND